MEWLNFTFSRGKGKVLGFGWLYFPTIRLKIQVTVLKHEDGTLFVSLPTKEIASSDGRFRYLPIVRFDLEVQDKLQDDMIKSLKEFLKKNQETI